MSAGGRDLIPAPARSEEEERRLYHRDVADLSADELDAERVLIRLAIAERVFGRRRARIIHRDSRSTHAITDLEWLRQRADRLETARLARARGAVRGRRT